tara:strand:- start:7073 stop:8530 length:1458 start_codon:yes stop_codon:yes gene_type:complete
MKKKKILLLADDFRLPSGIGTISKEIILNTVHKYDWVQIGAAVKHPDTGKMFDLSADVRRETGVQDADVKVIPSDGYGNRNLLFAIIQSEKPDAIFHFTDPRYWEWLYALEHEIKTSFNIPLIYYSIWDDLPYPMWNAPFYGSCDLIMGISKQSDNIHREVLEQNGFGVYDFDTEDNTKKPDPNLEWDEVITGYVPHGLNHNIYKPISETDTTYKKFHDDIKLKNGIEFLVFWNNRNIRRKQPGDVILAFKKFRDNLPKDKQDTVGLLMHTQIVDNNGTDLRTIHENIAPDCKILFSEARISSVELNAMYNVADVTINIASNEGWGLSSTESLLSGTPIINNVTGGLQDQCRFEDADGNWLRFNGEFSTNHKGNFKKHGKWVQPVFPSNRSMQGSPKTPYIFDDRCQYEEVSDAIAAWYFTPAEEREECGEAGREFCLSHGLTSKQMGNKMIEMIDFLFDYPKDKRPKYTLNKVESTTYKEMGIV